MEAGVRGRLDGGGGGGVREAEGEVREDEGKGGVRRNKNWERGF